MNNIKGYSEFSKLNEKVIMPKDFSEMINKMIEKLAGKRSLTIKEANDICNPDGVKFLTYKEFYDSLSDELKHTAPPSSAPLFGFCGPDHDVNIVIGTASISMQHMGFIHHMIQHESIHTQQWDRRTNKIKYTLPDPKNRGEYFSTSDEIMAFSQSMVDMMMTHQGLKNMDALKRQLKYNPLWSDIKASGVSKEVKKKYLKYIYLYAEKYLNKDEVR